MVEFVVVDWPTGPAALLLRGRLWLGSHFEQRYLVDSAFDGPPEWGLSKYRSTVSRASQEAGGQDPVGPGRPVQGGMAISPSR